MTYNEQIKIVLEKIKNKSLTKDPLPGMDSEEYFSLIEDCERNGYISTYMKQIVFRYFGGGEIADGITLTKKGHDFLDGNERTSTFSQEFHIQSVNGSNFGNYGTVNNNFGISIEELNRFIESSIEPKDRKQAHEIVATIRGEDELKPGMLKKFDSLLEKYPGLSDNVGKLLITLLTNGI